MIYGFTGPLLPRDMGPYGALTLLVFYSGKGRGGPLPFSSEPLRVPRILLDPGLPLKALEKVIHGHTTAALLSAHLDTCT